MNVEEAGGRVDWGRWGGGRKWGGAGMERLLE